MNDPDISLALEGFPELDYAFYKASDAMQRFANAIIAAADPCCACCGDDPINDRLFMRFVPPESPTSATSSGA